MINIVVNIIQKFNLLYNWLKEKDQDNIQRSANILGVLLIVLGVLLHFCNNAKVREIIIFSFVLFCLAISSVFMFDTSDRITSKISRKKYTTMRELLKDFSHVSYLYGLIFVSSEIVFLVEVFIFVLTCLVCNEPQIIAVTEIWLSVCFMYTFFYFSYHIYYANSKKKIEMIKQRLLFYLAMGTTINFFILLIDGVNRLFGIFIAGTMLQYTWLQYFMTMELNKEKFK